MKLTVWTVNILIEVQRVFPVCCGTWATGIAKLTANVHFLNTWKSSDHTSSFILILNTDKLGRNLCTTISSSRPSRTSQLTWFLNCEASTLYDSRQRLEESGWTTCFNDFTDVMCAARLGKDGYINQIAGYSTNDEDVSPRFVSWAIFEILWGKTRNRDTNEIEDLTRSRMAMTRVCIYHVNQSHTSRAAAMCGEVIATMCWECVRYEVDIVAGDGNKAAYYATPKAPGVPTYECSLLQFWIDRMINTATQARIKQYGPSPKVRAKHFITCSYNDLVHLSHNLRNITTEKYIEELAKKTEGYGDCCMLSVLEWGHSSNYFSEDFGDYDDGDHMDYEGEFSFQVNETCLHGNSKSFLISQVDRDSHNPLLVHLTSQEMTWNEARTYIH